MNSDGFASGSIYNRFLTLTSPCDHLVHFYKGEDSLLGPLADHLYNALSSGDSAVIICTPQHRKELKKRLTRLGIDIRAARSEGRFVVRDADRTLLRFMRDGWPSHSKFESVIRDVVVKARGNGRDVHAFGEMVALLWQKGLCDAAIRLEHLWNGLLSAEGFSLYCAYPSSLFSDDTASGLEAIRAAHSQVVLA